MEADRNSHKLFVLVKKVVKTWRYVHSIFTVITVSKVDFVVKS